VGPNGRTRGTEPESLRKEKLTGVESTWQRTVGKRLKIGGTKPWSKETELNGGGSMTGPDCDGKD